MGIKGSTQRERKREMQNEDCPQSSKHQRNVRRSHNRAVEMDRRAPLMEARERGTPKVDTGHEPRIYLDLHTSFTLNSKTYRGVAAKIESP